MSKRSEDGANAPDSDSINFSKPGNGEPGARRDTSEVFHQEDETLSRVTRTAERGIAPGGWENAARSDQDLLETMGGVGQPFALDIDSDFRRTAEFEGAFSRGRRPDDYQRQRTPNTGDPFEMAGFRIFDRPDFNGSRSQGEAISVGLDGEGARVEIKPPWAQFLAELRDETDVERDVQLRASYAFLGANLLRLHAAHIPEAGDIADAITGATAQLPGGARAALAAQVANFWADAGPEFVAAIEKLERWDARRDPQGAGRRRASIALERLWAGGLDKTSAARLQAWLYTPETLAGLVFRGICAHQQGERVKAAQIWGQVAPYLREEPRRVLADARAYFLRDTPEFFERMHRRANRGAYSRPQLLMMQRHAALHGDHRAEVVALYALVGADVARGKRAHATHDAPWGQNASQARLKELAAARFFRLSTLLHKFKRTRRQLDGSLADISAYRVLHDAVSLAPNNRVYLRRMVRWSRERGDLKTCAKSLRTLARDYPNPCLAALAATELARTIYLSAARLKPDKIDLVHRYLREALAHDARCVPARLALRRLHLSAQDLDIPRATASDEAAFIARDDWAALAKRLTQKLDDTADPQAWSLLAFRIAQLHAWHLSPIADSRLRAEFLEQVLIGAPEHVAALVELLDVRLARREYPAAIELLNTLSGLTDEPDERAFWLVERAELIEHHMSAPVQAAHLYQRALGTRPTGADAFLGLLRCDGFLGGDGAANGATCEIISRLDAGVSVHESEALAVELMLRAEESEAARDILETRFKGQPLWQFIRLCRSLEHPDEAKKTVDFDALRALKRMWMLPQAVELLDVFERVFSDPIASRQPPTLQRVKTQLRGLDIAPDQEGRVLGAMHAARTLNNPEIFGLLAALNARRSLGFIGRETHLLGMAISFMWRGKHEQALHICEHILARFPDFVPALKLAKILGPRLGRWAEVARWCELEARRTRVERVGFESRLMASEVQQNYLGDFDAACQQFRTLLQQDPAHPEAFEKLKELLLQRGEIDEVLEIFEQRISQTVAVGERVSMLNSMGEVALYRANNTRLAAGYFARSLELDRKQLRILRIIGELHHEVGDFEAAIRAYRDAVALSEHTVLIERLLQGIAALHEAADQPDQALGAYKEALAIDPDRVQILLDIARMQMDCGVEEQALESLARLVSHEKDASNSAQARVLREALSRRAQCLARLERPHNEVVSAYRELLGDYPDAIDDVDVFCEYMRRRGYQEDLAAFFDALSARAFLEMKGRPFAAHFEIARRLGHAERAFNLAAVAKVLGYSSNVIRRYYAVESLHRRWPSRSLPDGIIEELTPASMTPAFLGVLRHTDDALAEVCLAGAALPSAPSGATRLNPHDAALPEAIQTALEWPALFGFTLCEAYEYSIPTGDAPGHDALAGGSLVLENDGVSLYLDRRWRQAEDPTELLVHLGQQLAAWRLGVGRWQFLDLRARFLAVSSVVDSQTPGWGSGAGTTAEGIDLGKLQRWVQDTPVPELAVHALDLSARLSVQAVEPQFRLLELTLERAACVLLDDPARFLPHTKYLGSEHGMLQQPWSFLFTELATHIRQHIGVAREPDTGPATDAPYET